MKNAILAVLTAASFTLVSLPSALAETTQSAPGNSQTTDVTTNPITGNTTVKDTTEVEAGSKDTATQKKYKKNRTRKYNSDGEMMKDESKTKIEQRDSLPPTDAQTH